jgi:hypothetical protein
VDIHPQGSAHHRLNYKGRPRDSLSPAGIDDFHFYDPRHCFTTNMRRKEVRDSVIMAIISHKTAIMFNRYNHVGQDELRAAILEKEDMDSIWTVTLKNLPRVMRCKITNLLKYLVPGTRLELVQGYTPRDFKSLASTRSATQAFLSLRFQC